MLHTLTRQGLTFTAFAALLTGIALTGVYAPDASAGQVYKWVDENGVVTFGDKSQRPPTTAAERINIKAGSPASSAASTGGDDAADTDEGKQDASQQQKKPGDKQAEQPAQATPPAAEEKPKMPVAEKRKRCKQARADLAVIKSRGQVRETDGKGNTVYLSEQQKQNRIKALNKNIREYCR
jgi:hypothetical protein